MVVAMLVYAQVLEAAGFIPATIGFLITGAFVLGERRWLYLALGSIPLTGGFYLMMDFLDIYLEPGTWTSLLPW